MSASKEHWMKEYKEALPDLKKEDIIGSCFAIREYTVHEDFGGERSLSDFRKRLHAKGMKLMLDFVPNHTALDHAWVKEEPVITSYSIHYTKLYDMRKYDLPGT